MKIEMAESLIVSWLKHIKKCKIIQTNWKASNLWDYYNQEMIQNIMSTSNEHFQTKYNVDLFKKTSQYTQMLKQAEIDVLGIAFTKHADHIYSVDVAFHEFGLQYGSKEMTIAKIIKKIIRTALCLYSYFDRKNGTIIFASPKVSKEIVSVIQECMNDVEQIFREFGLYFEVQFITNDNFYYKILNPVNEIVAQVADTSELFIQSAQMQSLFAKQKADQSVTLIETATQQNTIEQPFEKKIVEPKKAPTNTNVLPTNPTLPIPNNFDHMKIGVIVRNVLRKILEADQVSDEEIKLMQSISYSKQTFGIQYPLLIKASSTGGISPKRYYSEPLTIKNESYFLCSEWYETPANNDRPYLIKWLTLHH